MKHSHALAHLKVTVAAPHIEQVSLRNSFIEKLRVVRTRPCLSPQVLRSTVQAPLNGAPVVMLDCNHEIPIERRLEIAGLIEASSPGVGEVPR